MKTTKPEATYFGAYPHSFRVHAHKLIALGYRYACQRIRSDSEEEPTITGFITEGIQDQLRALECPGWFKNYFVKEDTPIKKKGKIGRRRPRPDIIIESNLRGRPEYIFEAKLLRKQGHGADKYLGADGMGCFISGRYAERYDEAAMLGYIQSDSLVYWKTKVKSAVDTDESKLLLKKSQHDVKIIDDFPFEWISTHERYSINRSINIYHILLDCRVKIRQ